MFSGMVLPWIPQSLVRVAGARRLFAGPGRLGPPGLMKTSPNLRPFVVEL
jgi:hypothetical protein